MRHVRSRRRFKAVLILLMAICLALFFENRLEAFIPHLKNFAIMKIEEALDGRVKLSIENIDGGIIHPIAFENIRIMDTKNAPLFPAITIRSIKTNYRIWDLIFRNKNNELLMRSILGDSHIDMTFVTNNKDVSGFVRFNRASEGLKAAGFVKIFGKETIDFNGIIRDDSFDIELKPKVGSLKMESSISESGDLITNFKVSHLELRGFDIVCDGILKNTVTVSADNSSNCIEGTLEARNFMLNYKPFLDLKASYKISNGILTIKDLGLSDTVKISGSISAKKPYDTDMRIIVNNVSLVWLVTSLGAKEGDSAVSGTMNGKFEIKGPIDKLVSKSVLEIRKGMISTLDFDYLTLNLKGEGPIIRIEESRITRQSGYFTLAGEMDLNKIGKDIFFKDIKITSDDRAITWDGWDVSRLQGADEVRMKKRLSEDINVDFKKFESSRKVDESMAYRDEVQLEYKLHANESLKMMVGKDRDFLGFEHKDRF